MTGNIRKTDKGAILMGIIRLKVEVIKNWLKNKTTPPRNSEEMADQLGISQSLFSMILSDKRQVTPSVLRKLCELTGYDVGDLCFYDRSRDPVEE